MAHLPDVATEAVAKAAGEAPRRAPLPLLMADLAPSTDCTELTGESAAVARLFCCAAAPAGMASGWAGSAAAAAAADRPFASTGWAPCGFAAESGS